MSWRPWAWFYEEDYEPDVCDDTELKQRKEAQDDEA